MEYLNVITIFYFFTEFTDSSYASKEYIDCQPPLDPLYGTYEIKRKSYVPTDIIIFSCHPNTYLFGSKYLICQTDGQWNSTVPICVTSTARKLMMAENELNYLTDGNYTSCFDEKKRPKFEFKYDGNNPEIILRLVHDQIQYKPRRTENVKMNNKECTEIRTYESKEGKKIFVFYEFKCLASVGNSNNITLYDSLRRICELEIFWEKNSICPDLSMDPNRGSIRYENNLGNKEAVYSSAAIYKCNAGHKLLGQSVRYCTEYGRWTGNETTCIMVGCGNYSSISNGRITYTNKSTNGMAKLQCNKGYKPKFKTIGDASVCQPNGSWTFVPFECEEVFCFESPSSTKGMEWILEKRPSPVGHKARVQCYPDYAMFGGPLLIECLQNGNWSETTAICKNIASLTNTKMIAIAAFIGAGSSAIIFSIIICIIIFKKRLTKRRQPKDPNLSNTHTRLNTYQADGNEYFAIVYEEVPPVKAKKPNSPLPKVPSCETEFNYSLPIDQNKESEKENRYTYSQPQDAFQLSNDKIRKSLKRRNSSADSTYWRECNDYDDKSDVFKPNRLNSNSSLPDISITKSLIEDLYSSD